MAGRTPHEAVRRFLRPLQQALSCATAAVLSVSGGYDPDRGPHVATINEGLPVPLGGSPRLYLAVTQRYRIVEADDARGPWKTQTAGYFYQLADENEHEILVHHWHPSGHSRYARPHAHLGVGVLSGDHPLVGAHLPSGRVALEDVLWLALDELGVEPRRDDWPEVLETTRGAFEEWRTWPS